MIPEKVLQSIMRDELDSFANDIDGFISSFDADGITLLVNTDYEFKHCILEKVVEFGNVSVVVVVDTSVGVIMLVAPEQVRPENLDIMGSMYIDMKINDRFNKERDTDE